MAVHRSGSGPDVVLFHGGMGSWKRWIRNIHPLAAHYSVHALDHPSHGASAAVPRVTHLCLVSPAFRPADLLIGEIRGAVGALGARRIPRAGHWSAYENAPEVHRLMLEFFSSGPGSSVAG